MAANIDGMNPDFRNRLLAMINASGGRLTINSGYRSVQEQAGLWNAAVAKYGPQAARNWVAPPGHSNHGRGIAADLGGDLNWAHAHAAEFGLYFPMEWEPWHTEPLGSRNGQTSSGTVPPQSFQPQAQQKPNDINDGLAIIASVLPGATGGQAPGVTPTSREGQAPTVEPSSPSPETFGRTAQIDQPGITSEEEDTATSMPAAPPGQAGSAGDVLDQVRAGFHSVGRDDLAQMVGGPEFGAWINAESGWDPQSVSPPNNQGKPNGGLFQFWFGHTWAQPYFKGGKFTMSPFQQAQLAATNFNLTPEKIRNYAAQIHSGRYPGWG